MAPNPQQALILPSGCEAQLVNPFEGLLNRELPTQQAIKNYKEFEAANPPLKTTKEYKHLAGKVVNVVEVWQRKPRPIKGMDKVFEWETTKPVAYTKYKDYSDFERWHDEKDFDTRRSFEVLSEEESKPREFKEQASGEAPAEETVLSIAMKNTYDFLNEQSGLPKDFLEDIVVIPMHCAIDVIKDMGDQIDVLMKSKASNPVLSVEEAAEKYAHKKHSVEIHKDDFIMMQFLKDSISTSQEDFTAGANHIINSGEYVKVSDVENLIDEVLEKIKRQDTMLSIYQTINSIPFHLKNNK